MPTTVLRRQNLLQTSVNLSPRRTPHRRVPQIASFPPKTSVLLPSKSPAATLPSIQIRDHFLPLLQPVLLPHETNHLSCLPRPCALRNIGHPPSRFLQQVPLCLRKTSRFGPSIQAMVPAQRAPPLAATGKVSLSTSLVWARFLVRMASKLQPMDSHPVCRRRALLLGRPLS